MVKVSVASDSDRFVHSFVSWNLLSHFKCL